MNGFERDAEVTAFDFTLCDELLLNEVGFVCGQREADAIVITRRGSDLRVHADYFATHVHEWSATVAAIDGGVSLQKTLEGAE